MSETLTDDDNRLLDLTMNLRERMIQNIAKVTDSELPRKPSDLMAVTNLLESVDRTVIAKAKIRVDESSNKSQEAERTLLRNLMIEMHTNKNNPTEISNTSSREVPTYASIGVAVSDGELIPLSDNCNPTST